MGSERDIYYMQLPRKNNTYIYKHDDDIHKHVEELTKKILDKSFNKLNEEGPAMKAHHEAERAARLKGGWQGLATYGNHDRDWMDDWYEKDNKPSKPSYTAKQLISQAIQLLKDHKHLNIKRVDEWVEGTHTGGRRVSFSVINTVAPDVDQGTLVEVILPDRAFERRHHAIDDHAKISEDLDTDTYLRLRIAFLLYKAYKLNDRDATSVNLDIIKIIGHTTKPVFHW